MPRKNTIKVYSPNSYYHVYTRGNNKQKIFLSESDFTYFLMLINRYLIPKKKKNSKNQYKYPDFSNNIKIVSYCLMYNHFHLLVYVGEDSESLQKFMASIKTAYSMYFNKQHKRVGTVFESRYKAVLISSVSYLAHIHRYIHLNPKNWRTYRFSSLNYYFSLNKPEWLDSELICSEFMDFESYANFIAEYESTDRELHEISSILADT